MQVFSRGPTHGSGGFPNLAGWVGSGQEMLQISQVGDRVGSRYFLLQQAAVVVAEGWTI